MVKVFFFEWQAIHLIQLFLVFYNENIFEYFADKRFQEVKK